MSPEQTVRDVMSALESYDVQKAGSYLSDDFVVTGLAPQPLSKGTWLKTQADLLKAMSHWKFHLRDTHTQSDTFTAQVHNTGVHTGVLALPIPGLAPIQPTGVHLTTPENQVQYTVRDGKITTIHMTPVPGGIMMATLKQLGVTFPPA